MSEIVDPVLSKVTKEECKGRTKEENESELTATVDHLPIFARQADGDPRVGGAVGHGNVAISISLLLLGGDENLEIPCRIHDGNREGGADPETGVELLPTQLFDGEFAFLLDLERGTHVGGYRELVEIGLRL